MKARREFKSLKNLDAGLDNLRDAYDLRQTYLRPAVTYDEVTNCFLSGISKYILNRIEVIIRNKVPYNYMKNNILNNNS